MLKKLLSIAALLILGFGAAGAQTPMPLNPNIKHGKLANGLTYYVLHNAEPKNRANFYIAQRVGSTLEESNQLGLAHFLEHMAFNGTRHYPGKNMLNYLQSKGIRFGSDINAGTGFDQTVYNINNVPTTDKPLMDSVLLALRDWSCDILLEDDEIEAERGVIQEEWRGSDNANTRMITKLLKVAYEEPQYHQLPIGTMDVVMNFKPEALRAYYRKWYRPDLQGIIVVGDFDAAEMEAKIKEMFGSIPMPENAAERKYPAVSDNKEPIFFSFEDPEMSFIRAEVTFKLDKTPFEMRNTVEGYVKDELLTSIISSLINNRLADAAEKPDCSFAAGAVSFSDYLVSTTKGAFTVIAIGKDDMMKAFREALAIVARACKTGFTDAELERVKAGILAAAEKAYNERDKTSNGALAQQIINNFTGNTPNPGAEAEYMMLKQILPNVQVEAINQVAKELLTAENQVIMLTQPKREGLVLPSKEAGIAAVNDALNAEYEALVEEKITEPLIPQLPKPGSVKNTAANTQLGTTEMTLSNGVKVIVKPTDFSNDQIIFSAVRNGGMNGFDRSEGKQLQLVNDAVNASKLGSFDRTKLRKYMAGKNATVGFNLSGNKTIVQGRSGVKDLPSLMELIYANFTALQPDNEAWEASKASTITIIKSQENDPDDIFSKRLFKTWYGDNPARSSLELADVEKSDYAKLLQTGKDLLKNAADYTFVFTGNVDAATLKPLLEQYIATLPAAKTVAFKEKNSMLPVSGDVSDIYDQKMGTPSSMFYYILSGADMPATVKNQTMMSMAGQVIQIRFTEILREKEGGAYSPGAMAQYDPSTGRWFILGVVQCDPENQEKMRKLALKEMRDVLENGADDINFNKVKEASVKLVERNLRQNSFWHSIIVDNVLTGHDLSKDIEKEVNGITKSEFNAFMKGISGKYGTLLEMRRGVKAD